MPLVDQGLAVVGERGRDDSLVIGVADLLDQPCAASDSCTSAAREIYKLLMTFTREAAIGPRVRPTDAEHQSIPSQRESARDGRRGRPRRPPVPTRLAGGTRRRPTEPSSAPPTAGIALESETLEFLAELIATKLDAREAARSGWVGAETVAAHLVVNVQWVYDHGYELGGIRLGDGTTQGRWRFKLERIDELLEKSSANSSRQSPKPSVVRRQRRRSAGIGVELLPVKSSGGVVHDS